MTTQILRLLWVAPALALLLPPAAWFTHWYSFGVAERGVVSALVGAHSIAFLGATVVGVVTLLMLAVLPSVGDVEGERAGLLRARRLAALAVLSPGVFWAMQVVTLVLSGHGRGLRPPYLCVDTHILLTGRLTAARARARIRMILVVNLSVAEFRRGG